MSVAAWLRWCTAWVLALACGCVSAASVERFHGAVQLVRGGAVVVPAVGLELQENDELVTGEGGEILLRLDERAQIAVRPSSHLLLSDLRLSGPRRSRRFTGRLMLGAMRYVSGHARGHHDIRIITPTSTVGPRGTDLEVAVVDEPTSGMDAGTYLRVNSGAAVIVGSDGSELAVAAGEVAHAAPAGLAPRAPGVPLLPLVRKLAGPADVFPRGALDALLR